MNRSWLRYFVDHPTAANLIMVIMVLLGLAASTQIRSQFFPDIVVERITVRVPWSGAGPEDVDRAIIEPLEPSLRAIEGVEETRTLAREGRGQIRLEFEPGADLSAAVDEVEAAVDAVVSLPEEAEEPVIQRGRYRDRVTNVVISGDVPVEQLTRYADELTSALFSAGITRVDIQGVAEPLIRIEPSEATLRRYGLTLREIAQAVAAEVEARPAGTLGETGARIRAGVARKTLERLGEIVLRAEPDGSKLLLRDVATIREDDGGRGLTYFRQGQPAVQLRIDRSAAGDSIKLQDQVAGIVAELSPSLPEGVSMELTRTRSQYIKDRLDVLLDNAALGLAIVLGLLFLFLSARSAFWVAAGIPVALLATVAIMYLAGLTLNVVSLFGLLIALGIIVDDAIVVSEHADHQARLGRPPAEAAAIAAQRMAGPVFSASVTTVLAFAALTFIEGRFGTLIADIPRALIVILVASLIECFLILPAHMRHSLAHSAKKSWIDWPSTQFNRGFEWVRENAFRPLVRGTLRARYAVLLAGLGLLATSAALYHRGDVRWFFFHSPERSAITANIAMLPGATRAETREMLEEMQRALDRTNDHFLRSWQNGAFDNPEGLEPVNPVVDSLYVVGGHKGRALSGADTKDEDLLGGFEVELIDSDRRPFRQRSFARRWQKEIERHPMLETLVVRGVTGGPAADAIDVEITGAEPRVLKAASLQLQDSLARFDQVSALEDSMPFDRPELVLTLTPMGEALGFTTQSVGAEMRARLNGIIAARFARDAREVEVEVALPEEALDPSLLDRTFVPIPSSTETVALADIVAIEETQGFAAVRRSDGAPVIRVSGDITLDAELRAEVREAMVERVLPDLEAQFGVETRVRGLAEQEQEFLSDALLGFMLCLGGIYLTLAWIFASWARPVVVLLIIPFGLIGALWGHYHWGVPLSMFSVVGMIGMAGIIINDSIVLVTTIDEEAPRRPMLAAVEDATVSRLRAVLLTTLTTVGGLLPLLMETSQQAMFLKPTVITLTYGLGFGMVLVLLLTPAMVMVQHDVKMAIRSARRMPGLLRRFAARNRPRAS